MLETDERLLVPERTLEQRMVALKGANRIRQARAEWKRMVRRHPELRLAPFEDRAFETMKVIDYLLALPKVGRVKANKTLVQTRISPSKTIGGLTERQRVELMSMLPGPRRTVGR
jgi:hypothetical protein